jgi:hypothetical protein
MQYRLRTLLIVLALGPPVIAALWWMRQYATLPKTAGGGVLALVAFVYGVSISVTLLVHAWRAGRSKQPPKL